MTLRALSPFLRLTKPGTSQAKTSLLTAETAHMFPASRIRTNLSEAWLLHARAHTDLACCAEKTCWLKGSRPPSMLNAVGLFFQDLAVDQDGRGFDQDEGHARPALWMSDPAMIRASLDY